MVASGKNSDLSAMGSLFMVGMPGPRVDRGVRELVRELHVGGIVLFGRNLESCEQVWELTRELQEEALAAGPLPLLIAVDQEGGTVQRLKEPFTRIPAARDLGTVSSPAEVAALSRTVARELALVGINMNLAPVLDVARLPDCPQWGRSYSSDPDEVAAFGAAAIRGFLEGGVLPVAKHFPGLGDTVVDSHQVLPVAQDPDPDRIARSPALSPGGSSPGARHHDGPPQGPRLGGGNRHPVPGGPRGLAATPPGVYRGHRHRRPGNGGRGRGRRGACRRAPSLYRRRRPPAHLLKGGGGLGGGRAYEPRPRVGDQGGGVKAPPAES